jgi:predicted RecB family nuclease
MKRSGSDLQLSATDVANHTSCRHLTALNLAVADGRIERPAIMRDLVLERLGLEHEKRYLDHLRNAGLDVVEATDVESTVAAMRAGASVVYQAQLRQAPWVGRPDFLRRIELPSALGSWSYEVYDTKLAKEARASAVLQLCLYSELVETIQGHMPEWLYIVPPRPDFTPDRFRLTDFLAYYRQAKRRLTEAVARSDEGPYPEPVDHCGVCDWSTRCDDRRHADDHLSLVAGASRTQRTELVRANLPTLEALGRAPTPLGIKPKRGSAEALERVRAQANVQLRGREAGTPLYDLIAVEPLRGLALLPEPSARDVFLDLEGDPFVDAGGREYLFGIAERNGAGNTHYTARWGLTGDAERRAFEATVDHIMAQWAADPGMHIYHYAPYEPSAFKRLMSRFGTREDEIDRLLRASRFVDLYSVVRQGVRCSVESYSIKRLEPFYDLRRDVDLRDASTALRRMEQALALGELDAITADLRSTVESYNQDDCVSALRLRDWLEARRAEHERAGVAVPRPVPPDGDGSASDELTAKLARVRAVAEGLLNGVPEDPENRTAEQQARYVLAHLLEWHRRENKSVWWDYYRLRDLPPDEVADEPCAVTGLTFASRMQPKDRRKSVVDRYEYPAQEIGLRLEMTLNRFGDGEKIGEVVWIDRRARQIDIKKTKKTTDEHPSALFAFTHYNAKVMEEALLRLGEEVAEHGFDLDGPHAAACQLLLGMKPRLRDGRPLPPSGDDVVAVARQAARDLDSSVLAIQGPPGAGKTYTGARMILSLIANGKRVGVTANSHEVIRNLMVAIRDAATDEKRSVRLLQKVPEPHGEPGITDATSNDEVLAALDARAVDVVGGTAWLWAREDMRSQVDVLVIDEAGQVALANVCAVGQSASSLVLLGDPQQLEQPHKGVHPDGCGGSALQHLFRGDYTVREGAGLFLGKTWRMAPPICSFTSEVFYESRLTPRPGLERQQLVGASRFAGAGLHYYSVEHSGNRNTSAEEVDAVDAMVSELLAPRMEWNDADGNRRRLTQNDILVIAPYNLHVAALSERLGPRGVSVGTVDKFQGQEAPVVIYTMATSSVADAPRGMEFLFSLNRLNVATSRARAVCILVASPKLFEPECKSPAQIRMTNAMCRFLELAVPHQGSPVAT